MKPKNCPCCGSRAVAYSEATERASPVGVQCGSCPLKLEAGPKSVELWNKRSQEEPTAEFVKSEMEYAFTRWLDHYERSAELGLSIDARLAVVEKRLDRVESDSPGRIGG